MVSLMSTQSFRAGCFFDERADPGDDFARPIAVPDDPAERLPGLLQVGRLGGEPARAR
jgi:hypothetical protein